MRRSALEELSLAWHPVLLRCHMVCCLALLCWTFSCDSVSAYLPAALIAPDNKGLEQHGLDDAIYGEQLPLASPHLSITFYSMSSFIYSRFDGPREGYVMVTLLDDAGGCCSAEGALRPWAL